MHSLEVCLSQEQLKFKHYFLFFYLTPEQLSTIKEFLGFWSFAEHNITTLEAIY